MNDFLSMSNEDILAYNEGNKFDVVLMNPPYDKTICLKFLAKMIELSNKIISIQPLRWLQDPFAMHKRSTLKSFEKSIAQHINDIEIIKSVSASKDFSIEIYSDLGIYFIDNQNNNKINYQNFWKNTRSTEEVSIIQKVCFNDKCDYLGNVVEENKRDGIRVPLTFIAGNRGNLPIYKDIVFAKDGFINNKDWTKVKNMGGYLKKENSAFPNSIKFDTEKEAINFYNSYNTLFFKYVCAVSVQQQHIQADYLPFMNDYTHEWTDEMLYKFFDLSEDEIKEVENFNKN